MNANGYCVILILAVDMSDRQTMKDRRIGDPFLDRRCGDDRREAYELGYFSQGGIERRSGVESRQNEKHAEQP